MILKTGPGRNDYQEDKSGNQAIRMYFHKDNVINEEFLSDEKTKNVLIKTISSGVIEFLLALNFDDNIYRFLIYNNNEDHFFSIVVLIKYSSKKLSAVNMKEALHKSLHKEYVFPFLISNYETHISIPGCTWDISHSLLGPEKDLKTGEISELLQNNNIPFLKDIIIYSLDNAKLNPILEGGDAP